MKVLLITSHFYPETFRCNDIAFELVEKGYDVDVLTAIPDYPQGKYYDGYGIFRKRIERIKGVKVYRAFIIPRGHGGPIRLAINYISYIISSIAFGLYLAIRYRYDRIFVHEVSPIFVGIPAVYIKKIQKIPLVFWVLDLWPETLKSYGKFSSGFIYNQVDKLTRWIYNNCDRILISSLGFRSAIAEKGVDDAIINYFPNWADKDHTSNIVYEIPEMPQGFILMYAGNIGTGQNFINLMKAAEILKDDKNINFVILGDGSMYKWVESFIMDNNLSDTVHLLGQFPSYSMPSFYKKADAMIVSLTSDFAHNNTLPAKVQGYMLAKKPILGLIDGEGQTIINEAKCGFACGANDYKGFASLVRRVASMDKEERIRLGENGSKYSVLHFNYEKCMNNLDNILKSL